MRLSEGREEGMYRQCCLVDDDGRQFFAALLKLSGKGPFDKKCCY